MFFVFVTVLMGQKTSKTDDNDCPPESTCGKVTVSVLDPNGYFITNVRVTLKNDHKTYTFVVDDNGPYELAVFPGVYSISTESNIFYPVRRARFRVTPQLKLKINLRPVLRISSIATRVGARGFEEPVTIHPDSLYEELDKPIPPDPQLNYLFEFRKKHRSRSYTTFRKARFSYDHLTISSDKITFNRSDMMITFRGDVIVDDGNTITTPKAVKFDLRSGNQVSVESIPSPTTHKVKRSRKHPPARD